MPVMPLFYFAYRYKYNIEVDEETVDIHISVGVCLWFFRLDVVLKLGCKWSCIDVIVLGV